MHCSRRAAGGWLPAREIREARRFVTGGIMLDIGANVGATSIPRVALGDFSHVYAAEPEPANYAALVANIRANGLLGYVLPERVALGAQDGTATLGVHRGIATHALVTPDSIERVSQRTRTITVPVRALDSWVSELGIDPNEITFIKTDCQGWDGYVLEGARDILRYKHIVWQIEFWPCGMALAGMSLDDACALIARHFTHVVDVKLGDHEVRASAKLRQTLRYFQSKPRGFTELILLNIEPLSGATGSEAESIDEQP